MNKSETAQILKLISLAYPFQGRQLSEDDAKGVVAVWAKMLAAYPKDCVLEAVERHIETVKFPPTIANIRETAKFCKDGTAHPDGGIWMNGKQLLGANADDTA